MGPRAPRFALFPLGGTFRTGHFSNDSYPPVRPGGSIRARMDHPIRVTESVDVRFLLEDMFAKIRKFGRQTA